jgi:hypothetical protein
MKKQILNKFKKLGIQPYYLELYSQLFIFALNKEQYVKALIWYNENIKKVFSPEDMEMCLDVCGLNATVNKSFNVIYIPVDELLDSSNTFVDKTGIQYLFETANHEITHAVLNIANFLDGDFTSNRQQEPMAYLSGWLMGKFFEELNRQGFTLQFTKSS